MRCNLPGMLESLLTTYGYPFLVIGTFLEGEAILVMAGVIAHIGYLSLGWVIVCGFVGSVLGDQLFFVLGRRRGRAILARRPGWQARTEVVLQKLERHQIPLLLGFRFMYGLRTITPFAIGLTNISYARFAVFNVISAAIWASAVSMAGYYFGQAIEAVLGSVKKYEAEVLTGMLAAALLFWLAHFFLARRRDGSRSVTGH